MAKVYKDAKHTSIVIDVKTSVAAASAVAVFVYKPDSSTAVEWAATASGTTIIIDADGTTREVDVAGEYRFMPYVTEIDGEATGWSGYCDLVSLRVWEPGT